MCCLTKSDKSDKSDSSDGSGAKKAAPGGRSLVYVAVLWGSVGEFVGYGVAVVEDYVEQIHAFGLC